MSIGGVALEAMDDAQLSTLRLRTIGFVFQFFNLLPALTAQENAALPLLLAGHPGRQAAARAAQLLTWVQLEQRLLSRPVNSQAVKCSASPWHARWPMTHPLSSPMSPRAISIRTVALWC